MTAALRERPAQLTIGCHLSSSKGYVHMAKDAEKVGGSTFQFFTRNPRGCKAKDIDPADVAAFHERCGQQGIGTILAHAPYTLNPCSAKPDVREFARMVLADDLQRMEHTPHQLYNMHPGSHVGQGAEEGIRQIADALNQVLRPEQTTTVLLETMAGKGSEVGRTFQEIRDILDRVELADQLMGVCLDTCHVWDGGYNIVDDLDGVLEEFDRVIGLERLRAIHLNDSKNPCGAHKDRHERIGEGCIGFDALSAVTNHPALCHLPFYLETPQDKLEGWAGEIQQLKQAYRS
ncbi:MAG: deoxyribonuclease IV [Coriobacteriia bacterium]|nr:deoxyribonuclease IV [Coriobacteriia bacterium]